MNKKNRDIEIGLVPEGNEVVAVDEEGRREFNEIIGVQNGEREFLKVGTSGGTEPQLKHFGIRVITVETELPNVAGSTEGEYSIDEGCKFFETVVVKVRIVVVVEDLEMLPEVSPPVRDESHGCDGGSSWEEGQYMAQNGVR